MKQATDKGRPKTKMDKSLDEMDESKTTKSIVDSLAMSHAIHFLGTAHVC
eukprot:m.368336 g.368336  ORF g.368336 m.368336 type:complete len:50 (+) comp44654_c0_seq1:79-228(+)